MTTSVRQAKARLSELLTSAEQGEEIIITSHGIPRARLVPLAPPARRKLNLDKIRRIAKKAKTGKRPALNSTRIISDARKDR